LSFSLHSLKLHLFNEEGGEEGRGEIDDSLLFVDEGTDQIGEMKTKEIRTLEGGGE